MTRDCISAKHLERHLEYLCLEAGVRLAGTPGEAMAAEYAASGFAAAGADVAVETFPVKSRAVQDQRLEVFVDGAWRAYPCSLFSSTPGTGGLPVEAPLVFFEAPAEQGRADLSHLRGKAVVHLGCHIESRDVYRRLIQARPAFLMFVDVRYPGTEPLADGMFPAYTRDLGAVPVVNVAYQDAWHWTVNSASAARLTVSGGMVDGVSQNVIAELRATTQVQDSGILFLGAHHDTQADSVGADDNGTGVVSVLELARVLAPLPRRRTIRLISFGAEEQLSVGSARYVRAHRAEIGRDGKLIFNIDSIGSWMGWNELMINGPAALSETVSAAFAARNIGVRIDNGIMPYADHFPFVAAGCPGVTLIRLNCAGGRFFHHRGDDDLSRVGCSGMAERLEPVADLIAEMALRPALPFDTAIPGDQARDVEKCWVDLFSGWDAE